MENVSYMLCFQECWKAFNLVTISSYQPSKSDEQSLWVYYQQKVVDHLNKCSLLRNKQYGLSASWFTADVLIIVTNREALIVTSSEQFQGLAWSMLHKFFNYGIFGRFLLVFKSFLSVRLMKVVINRQEPMRKMRSTQRLCIWFYPLSLLY